MTKTKLQLADLTTSQDSRPAAPEIFEVHNLTIKQALQLVRSLAIASQQAHQTESPRSK